MSAVYNDRFGVNCD